MRQLVVQVLVVLMSPLQLQALMRVMQLRLVLLSLILLAVLRLVVHVSVMLMHIPLCWLGRRH